MDKCNWVSIVLDGSVPPETICSLIDFSYQLTGSKSKSSKKEIEP